MTKENKPLEGEVIPKGRPSTFKPEMLEVLEAGLTAGATDTELMAILDISRDTFYRWRQQIPEFKEVYDRGAPKCEAKYIAQLRNNFGNKAFNTPGFQMFMRNKFGWDANENKGTTANNNVYIGNLTVNSIKQLPTSELEDEIRRQLELAGGADSELIRGFLEKKA